MYLLIGVTGGVSRGKTSHFMVPNLLFPKKRVVKVIISHIGCLVVLVFVYKWYKLTTFIEVLL